MTTLTAVSLLARVRSMCAGGNATVDADVVRRVAKASKAKFNEALSELTDAGYCVLEPETNHIRLIPDVDEDAAEAEAAAQAPVGHDDQGHDPNADAGWDRESDDEMEADDQDDPEDKPAATIVPDKYRRIYKATRNTCGDDLAYAISDFVNAPAGTEPRKDGKGTKKGKPQLSLVALAQLAVDNGIDPMAIKGNNNGQKRMNLSNMLRGMIRNGKDVEVNGQLFKGEAKPKTKKDWLAAKIAAAMDANEDETEENAKHHFLATWDAHIEAGYHFDPMTCELVRAELDDEARHAREADDDREAELDDMAAA